MPPLMNLIGLIVIRCIEACINVLFNNNVLIFEQITDYVVTTITCMISFYGSYLNICMVFFLFLMRCILNYIPPKNHLSVISEGKNADGCA